MACFLSIFAFPGHIFQNLLVFWVLVVHLCPCLIFGLFAFYPIPPWGLMHMLWRMSRYRDLLTFFIRYGFESIGLFWIVSWVSLWSLDSFGIFHRSFWPPDQLGFPVSVPDRFARSARFFPCMHTYTCSLRVLGLTPKVARQMVCPCARRKRWKYRSLRGLKALDLSPIHESQEWIGLSSKLEYIQNSFRHGPPYFQPISPNMLWFPA